MLYSPISGRSCMYVHVHFLCSVYICFVHLAQRHDYATSAWVYHLSFRIKRGVEENNSCIIITIIVDAHIGSLQKQESGVGV